MIKRIAFASRSADVSLTTFTASWPGLWAAVATAPEDARPERVAVCTTLPDVGGTEPRHDGIALAWFRDATCLARFDAWLDPAPFDAIADRATSPVVVADELVLRGEEWLVRRWRDGGTKFKHMAMARRAEGLTAAEFSARWKAHAGGVTSPATRSRVEIPPAARGLAYVQNHPVPRPDDAWAYDAVNEVYFDDTDALCARIAWFRDNVGPTPADDFIGASWFVAVREDIVYARI